MSVRYNKLAGQVKALAVRLKELNSRDPFRNKATTDLLEKLQVLQTGGTLDFVSKKSNFKLKPF